MADTNEQRKLSGVFSQTKTNRIGSGTTARKVRETSYFFVEEAADGTFAVQPLDMNGGPCGAKRTIGREELLEQYLPEPQKTLARVEAALSPDEEAVRKAVARGDKFRKRGETYTAEYEYDKALAIDEGNVRANFGIGLCYIERGEQDKAREVFERLVHLDAAFSDEHKHLFNEFGIALRKSGMNDEAMAYYRRALELAPDDENLHYNMARAAFAKGDAKAAAGSLAACLKLNPAHAEALRFVAYLRKRAGAARGPHA